MALSIKSDEADRLARELTAETGETLTEAVEIALRERLDREHARHAASMRTRLARLARQFAHGRRSRPVAWVLCHGGWVGSTPSRSRSRAWTGLGLGICAGLVAVAGISCMPARAVRMSRPAGRAGCWLYRPSILVCGARLRRASRSIRQKTSRARLITVISAAIRRLLCRNIGATASGPLRLPYRRSRASCPL